MRTIDLSKYSSESGLGRMVKSLQGALSFGYSWQQSRKNQEELVEILGSVLGNECVLLRDVNIPKVNRPIPLVLITPAQVMAINPKSQKGFFRAEGKFWGELGRNDEYRPAPINLIRETWLYQKTIEGYFKQHNFTAPMGRGVMIFVSPETVVESIRPRVRIIQADGIKNFARELSIEKPVLSNVDFKAAVNLLTHPKLPTKSQQKKEPPIELMEPAPLSEPIAKVDQEITKAARKINFTRKEWIIIGVLSALLIIVLIILITLVTLFT